MSDFTSVFGKAPEYRFSAPGRTEIGGNHTDHQHGCVLAAAIHLKTTAFVAENGRDELRVYSEGYPAITVSLKELAPSPAEYGTTQALVRGMAAVFAEAGAALRGFDAYVRSDVLPGSGLSSSAAFEVLLGTVINTLFYGGKASAVGIAKRSQRVENVWFGKPCGLMDQTACAVGGFVGIDFAEPSSPVLSSVDFDLASHGIALCIIDSGASHADLTDEYAAVTREMKAVSAVFGKNYLREVDKNAFYAALPEVRRAGGDRAALRGMHFFDENERARAELAALTAGDTEAFLRLVNESGLSSQLLLQNVVPCGATDHQEVALALALCKKLLGRKGACRIHGGGFAGTVQAFVPEDRLPAFTSEIEAVFGAGSCHVLTVSPYGGRLEEKYL